MDKLKTIVKVLDEKLAEDGYYVVNIQYPTVDDKIAEMTDKYIVPTIDEQVKKLNEINLERKAKNLPELKINFVVHSMGSCLIRYYLKEHKLDSLGKVVLISPPSHGSQLSDNPIADLLWYFIGPAVADMKTDKDSFVNQLGAILLVNSFKGEALFNMIKDNIEYENLDFEKEKKCNRQLSVPSDIKKRLHDYELYDITFGEKKLSDYSEGYKLVDYFKYIIKRILPVKLRHNIQGIIK